MSTTLQDLTIVLEDRPGALAKATEAIAAERINIEGGATLNCGGEGIFHALFKTEQDAAAAKRALEKAGYTVREQQPVVVTTAEDKPGEAARIYRAVADAKVNVEFTYIATNNRVVVGSKDPQKVTEALRTPATTGARR
ncbi:MAG TPA: hypothetical protein VGR87_11270 [Candidatus Limnocylindria bacterium]|nr:hypothetical protein [Candidatus Limnocylindria bacterium]